MNSDDIIILVKKPGARGGGLILLGLLALIYALIAFPITAIKIREIKEIAPQAISVYFRNNTAEYLKESNLVYRSPLKVNIDTLIIKKIKRQNIIWEKDAYTVLALVGISTIPKNPSFGCHDCTGISDAGLHIPPRNTIVFFFSKDTQDRWQLDRCNNLNNHDTDFYE